MKIVLLTDVEKLGQPGDVVVVKDGYARNLLIPAGMALKANPKALRIAETQRQTQKAEVRREVKTHVELAERLSQLELRAEVQVGEEDRMFGAVTSSDIAEL
ncbi:MAG: 50S ribosomal protein L9, partial [Candidatus Electryoneaceae bacterium]|nr:50S ribosomal protein L9 [Candidatus Electryoneaceae bacterium]